MNNQRGLAPIAIVILGVLVIIGFFVFILIVVKPFSPSSSNLGGKKEDSQAQNSISNGKAPKITCQSRDLGGCDTEKNFYKWKDDGKP